MEASNLPIFAFGRIIQSSMSGLLARLLCDAVGFCGDILLMSPTRDAMKQMLANFEGFATKNYLQFSNDPYTAQSKTKCIFVCL